MDKNIKYRILATSSLLDEALKKRLGDKKMALENICRSIPDFFKHYDKILTEVVEENTERFLFYNNMTLKPSVDLKFTIDDKTYHLYIYLGTNKNSQCEAENLEYCKDLDEVDYEIMLVIVNFIEKYLGEVDEAYFRDKNLYIPEAKPSTIKKLLTNFEEEQVEKNLVFDLMPFKVKNLLVIASVYDAFTIESEGNLSQKILGEFLRLNLTSFPRVYAVNTYEEAEIELQKRHYDLIIVVAGYNQKQTKKTINSLKNNFPEHNVFLLLNNGYDTSEYIEYSLKNIVEKIFVWNGDSRIFFSMIKLLEDRVNLENDLKYNRARIILLVEDSPIFYSRYLPELYMSIFELVRGIMNTSIEADDIYKLLYLRTRPRIIHFSKFEDARDFIRDRSENILGLITDVEFYKNNRKDRNAGFELAAYFKDHFANIDVPVIIQSHNIEKKEEAHKLGYSFIHKDAETLVQDIKRILNYNMGFGDFIYKRPDGTPLGLRAKTLEDFVKNLDKIDNDTLMYHASRNHFSLWLRAHGEFKISSWLSYVQVQDFKSPDELRSFLKQNLKNTLTEAYRGKIISFSADHEPHDYCIYNLSSGALGGKGRGLLFINKLLFGYRLQDKFKDINLTMPRTFIIGTDTYDEFMTENNLLDLIKENNLPYVDIKKIFLKSYLSQDIVNKFEILLDYIDKPLAVRSSGLLEDSLRQPFAGVYATYIIPNNSHDKNLRLKHLIQAVKLVYASIFSPSSRNYIKSVDYTIEQEKMAVVIQEVVGNNYDGYYYPHISGTAQSFNYYPFASLKPEDGLAAIALGLGMYVVSGGKTYHFSPEKPDVQNASLKDLVKNTQTYFYAVNLNKENIDLIKGEEAALAKLDVWDAIKHGTIKHLASVYDEQNDVLSPGLDKQGSIVLDFANILKYNYIPLAETLKDLLLYSKESIGAPVEIEFAVDLNKDKDGKASFYLLQIKPLLSKDINCNFNLDELPAEKILLKSDQIMGNGKIESVQDVIFVDPETFDKSKTEEIAEELDKLNSKMIEEGRKYILIAPGRLGTRDKWIGIPVQWSQISNAKIIVETSLPNFPLDASAGSHFFHNVMAMEVGYFAVLHNKQTHMIRWEYLKNTKIISQTNYVKHVRYDKPLLIMMDGKKSIAVILIKD